MTARPELVERNGAPVREELVQDHARERALVADSLGHRRRLREELGPARVVSGVEERRGEPAHHHRSESIVSGGKRGERDIQQRNHVLIDRREQRLQRIRLPGR